MNKPLAFDSAWIEHIRVNVPETLARANELTTRRVFKGASQAGAYLRAVACIDLTTLKGDDTLGRVERLCAKARRPVEPDIIKKLQKRYPDLKELESFPGHVGAVCVYHDDVAGAVTSLAGTHIPVAAVSTGFPAGKAPHTSKLTEIYSSIASGATEIDVVISRKNVYQAEWKKLYDEICSFREACGDRAKLKTIIARGDLGTLENAAKATACAIMAGSDFVKTSTGFEATNADIPTGLSMVRQIRDFYFATGQVVGFKAAGGIKEAKEAQVWLILMKEELGYISSKWLTPDLFRIGASSLLDDLQLQLEHCATGVYSADYYHPLG